MWGAEPGAAGAVPAEPAQSSSWSHQSRAAAAPVAAAAAAAGRAPRDPCTRPGGAKSAQAPDVLPTRVRVRDGCRGNREALGRQPSRHRWPARKKSGRSLVRLWAAAIAQDRASPLLLGVSCFWNKHAPRGLGACGGPGGGAGRRAGAGRGGVGWRSPGRRPGSPQGRCGPPPGKLRGQRAVPYRARIFPAGTKNNSNGSGPDRLH